MRLWLAITNINVFTVSVLMAVTGLELQNKWLVVSACCCGVSSLLIAPFVLEDRA